MYDVKTILDKLNSSLDEEHFRYENFNLLLKSFLELNKNKVEVKTIDFKHYTNDLLIQAKREQEIGLRIQNFEWVASWRDKENECIKYLEIKEKLKVEKSIFFFEQKQLVFLYLGSSKNDNMIKEIIKENYCNTPVDLDQRFS